MSIYQKNILQLMHVIFVMLLDCQVRDGYRDGSLKPNQLKAPEATLCLIWTRILSTFCPGMISINEKAIRAVNYYGALQLFYVNFVIVYLNK